MKSVLTTLGVAIASTACALALTVAPPLAADALPTPFAQSQGPPLRLQLGWTVGQQLRALRIFLKRARSTVPMHHGPRFHNHQE